jgi:ATP-dependent RNA helicase DHX37/DHR1
VLPPPSRDQVAKLNYIVAAGFVDQVAQRADLCPTVTDLPGPRNPKRATDVPYVTLFPSHARAAEGEDQSFVYIHAASVLAHQPAKSLPQYVVFSHLQRAAPATVGGGGAARAKIRMHPLCAVTGAQLTALARGTPLLQWGKPVGKVVDGGSGGRRRDGLTGKALRECFVVPSLVGEKGSLGWPLPAKRVVQRKEGGGKGWVVSEVLG